MIKSSWDSYKRIIEIRRHLAELIEAGLRQIDDFHDMPSALPAWNPPFDLVETDETVFLFGELPGLSKKDLKIQLDGLDLSVSGERRAAGPAGSAFHLAERDAGGFSRHFKLPAPIDEKQILTTLQNGVLEIRLPKRKPRTIPIQ